MNEVGQQEIEEQNLVSLLDKLDASKISSRIDDAALNNCLRVLSSKSTRTLALNQAKKKNVHFY